MVSNGSTNGNASVKLEICHDDSVPPVKAQTIDQLHSLQEKKPSTPTTPKKQQGADGASLFKSAISDQERQQQQLQSISASLASLTREIEPKVVKGEPSARKFAETPKAQITRHHHHLTASSSMSRP